MMRAVKRSNQEKQMKATSLEVKAKRALINRLARERKVYGMVGKPTSIKIDKMDNSGKGESFEAFVEFDEGYPQSFEVILYGGGKSNQKEQ
jgi:hypothetical protein